MVFKTGYHWDERYNFHDTGTNASAQPASFWPSQGLVVQPLKHPENALAKARIHTLLSVSGLLDHVTPVRGRYATPEELVLFHTKEYLARIETMSNSDFGGEGGECCPVGRGSFEVARYAVGSCLSAVDAIVRGDIHNAYCLVRPPGHHAEPDMGRGFCLLNNIGVAAEYAIKHHGVKSVAILDWDVHHGNGTQKGFYERDDVLFISMHQDNLYPTDSGAKEHTGAGMGDSFTINIPLPPGSGSGAYAYAMETIVVPSIKRFRPELIMVSNGFDASAMDPLGRMMLSSSDFYNMAAHMVLLSQEVCGGKLMLVHEGGYNPAATPYCGLKVMEALQNRTSGIVDPFDAEIKSYGYQEVQLHQRGVIDSIARC